MKTRLAAAVLAAAGGVSAACASVSLSSEMDLKTGLVGADYWAGLRRHPAVVNPVGRDADGTWLSLAGEWAYTNFPHGSGKRTIDFKNLEPWPLEGKMRVPGCWQEQGLGGPGTSVPHICQDDSVREIRGTHRGEVFYRRRIDVPAEWKGRRIWFKVGGVRSRGWFYVNDHAVGHLDVYSGAWKYDITDFVVPGRSAKVVVVADNVVANRNGQTSSCERWGGIVRDIELEATPLSYIDDAWVRGDFDGRAALVNVTVGGLRPGAKLAVRAEVEGAAAESPVGAADERGDAKVEVRVPLGDFRPWSPEHPNLYWAAISLVEDGKTVQTRRERFGVRKLEVRGREFYLNDRPFYIRGFGDDSIYPISGITPPSREFHLKHLRLARAAGFNFSRLHTHCETPEYFEAADEAGILISPELAYYLDEPSDSYDYDPVRDAVERWITFRRYPSYAVNCSGNEGLLGPGAGRIIYEFLKKLDPDRLVQEQDGGACMTTNNAIGRGDFCTGPLNTWERGSFDPPRAWYCHEYLNLCVKADYRIAADYTGTWLPPVTAETRARFLKPFGLSHMWGDILQDAQHALQRLWQKNGIEHARKDPFCDGYCYWTIADVTVPSRKTGTYTAQGLFDPFWRAKPAGASAADFAVFNSPSCILLDTEGLERKYSRSETLAKNWCIPGAPEETNRVFAVGETIPLEFIFSHYGESDLGSAELEWRFLARDGRTFGSGVRDIGAQKVGPARTVAKFPFVVPEVGSPVKVTLLVAVRSREPAFRQSNEWDFWFFPKRARREAAANTVVCGYGSKEAAAARAAGKSVLLLGETGEKPNYRPGWWWVGKQAGTAFLSHPALGDFPHERFLSPLHFRLIRGGQRLPVDGFEERDFIAVGDGASEAYLYLAAKERPDGGREVFVSGLDVKSGTPEAVVLWNNLLDWLEARPVATLTADNAEIVVAKGSAPAVRFAADEMTNFLSRVLGSPIPVVAAPSGGGKTSVILGESPWAKEAGVTVEGRPRDTFVIRADGNRIYIVGRDDPKYDLQRHIRDKTGYGTLFHNERATLFGVYDFLERYAGCRFYFPHELGEIVPRADAIRVTERERIVTPSFSIRDPYLYGDGKWFCERDKDDRGRIKSLEWLRLRFSTFSIPCCHGTQFFRYIERFGKDHPEYLAKKATGERWLDPKVFAPYQLCWSNPGLQEELYQDVKAYLTGKPPSSRGLKAWGNGCRGKFVDIMPDDSFQGCFCERCQAAYRRIPGDRHYATELMWGVTAKIAQRLIDEGIEGNVTQMAYPPYRRLPDFALPTNVYVMVAESGPWSMVDPVKLAADNAEIRAWAEKLGHKVWTWTYPHKWGATRIDGLASVGPRAWGEYYKGVAPWIIGSFAECESESSFGNHLNYIVFSRVCWDSEVDVEEVLDEYHRLMFGAGAQDMKEFFDTLERKWVRDITGRIADTPLGPIASPPSARDIWKRIYSPAERARLAAMLAAARSKVAPFSIEARRIDLMKREFFDGLDEAAKAWELTAMTVAADIYDAASGAPLVLENKTVNGKGGAKPGVRTEVHLSKTPQSFVVEWDCEEPDMANTLCVERKDGDVEMWSDNGVECRINPSNDGRTYYHFILNERGAFYCAKLIRDGARDKRDLSWSTPAKHSVEKTERGWRARLEIPLSSMPWFRDSFRGNFCRNRVRRAGEEFIMSSRHANGYAEFEKFGTVRLK